MGRPGEVVPIVPAAVIFDLGRGGRFTARPEEDWGYRAAALAHESGDHAEVERGNVGAGTGAQVADGRLKGGIGTASSKINIGDREYTIGALAVVNARGVPRLPGIDELLGDSESPQDRDREFNTTIAVIATDARLDSADTTRTASCAHDGLARALDPVHTLTDGDTVFALATGAVGLPEAPMDRIAALVAIQAAAATVLEQAVLDGVRSAEPVRTASRDYPSYRSLINDRAT